jgi:hypothetical protein
VELLYDEMRAELQQLWLLHPLWASRASSVPFGPGFIMLAAFRIFRPPQRNLPLQLTLEASTTTHGCTMSLTSTNTGLQWAAALHFTTLTHTQHKHSLNTKPHPAHLSPDCYQDHEVLHLPDCLPGSARRRCSRRPLLCQLWRWCSEICFNLKRST